MTVAYHGAESFLPARRSIAAMRRAVEQCHGCPLYRTATQAVFGEGPSRARMVLVGEQPGDEEDVQGRPFVGPSGKLLNDALAKAGIKRDDTYVTNVVKHFKWEPHGARRLHKKPDAREIAACRPWLAAELELVKPRVLVCLGATPAQAVFGRAFRVTTQRGRDIPTELATHTVATVHPSSVLRQRTHDDRTREFAALVDDLCVAAALLNAG